MGTIIRIIFGENMDEYTLGEKGVLSITETAYNNNATNFVYDVGLTNGTIERIFDIKRVTYKQP